jgi:hypothetical protein
MENGWSIFDFPSAKVANYRQDWDRVTDWIDELLAGNPAAPGSRIERPEIPPYAKLLRSTRPTLLQEA